MTSDQSTILGWIIGIVGIILGILITFFIENYRENKNIKRSLYERKLKDAEDYINSIIFNVEQTFTDAENRCIEPKVYEDIKLLQQELLKRYNLFSLNTIMGVDIKYIIDLFENHLIKLQKQINLYSRTNDNEYYKELQSTRNSIVSYAVAINLCMEAFIKNGYRKRRRLFPKLHK
jgi:hypothetical protein